MVDDYCNQPLRSTIDIETLFGPDFRMTVEPNLVTHALLSRWPITAVLSGRCSPADAFPRAWSAIPESQLALDEAVMPYQGTTVAGAAATGASGVYVAPGYIDWSNRRRGWLLEITYVNGWPHTATTAALAANSTAVPIDDCTGFAMGGNTIAQIYDGSNTETVTITAASVQSGPGTVTLSRGTVHAHGTGILLSTLPQSVMWATMMYAAGIAMSRGTTAITVQALPGSESHGGGGGAHEFFSEAEILLNPYRRVI